jgi:preprotein translocase subunit SecG
MLNAFLATLMILTSIFLILLILVQRGRGGGLAGALGGMGGQSAFGTKAGDLFTRITIGAAAFWIVLCIISVKLMTGGGNGINLGSNSTTASPGETKVEAESKTGEKAAAPASGTAAESKSAPATESAAPSTGTPSTGTPAPASDSSATGGAGATPTGTSDEAKK